MMQLLHFYLQKSNNIAIYSNHICTFLSPALKAAKLCFALPSVGRSFHSLVAPYLTDFSRKFEAHLMGGGGGESCILVGEVPSKECTLRLVPL